MRQFFILIAAGLFIQGSTYAQISFSVSPSKLYFEVPPGKSGERTVTVNNTGSEERTYSMSFLAWDRDTSGVKDFSPDTGQVFSCAKMLTAEPSVFRLAPGEEQSVVISLTHAPLQKQPSLWAMLMVRELNPGPSPDQEHGVRAVLNVEYQIGVHVYQMMPDAEEQLKLEVDTMYLSQRSEKRAVNLHVQNSSKVIGEVRLEVQLFSMNENQATTLPVRSLTFLPGHHRIITVPLPEHLSPGDYTVTATLDPGREYDLLAADFYFNIPSN